MPGDVDVDVVVGGDSGEEEEEVVVVSSRTSQGDVFSGLPLPLSLSLPPPLPLFVLDSSTLLSRLSSNVSIKMPCLFPTLLPALCVVETSPSSSSAPDPEVLLRIYLSRPRRQQNTTLWP